MPKAYLKSKREMQKTYGKERGKIITAKKWNKEHKGTGRTVGRGRR